MSGSITLPQDDTTAAAIKGLLRKRLGRQWQVGDKLPPVKELARQLGTGQSNTHLAVQELARDGLLVSRRRRGTYVANLPASSEQQAHEDLLVGREIVLYGSGPVRQFIHRMMDAFADEIRSTGAAVRRMAMSDDGTADFDKHADALVLFNPTVTEAIRCQPNQLLSIVSSTRYVSVDEQSRYDVVGIDDHQGGVLAGRMLREAGCKRPCFVGREMNTDATRYDPISMARLHGFEDGWGEPLANAYLLKAKGYNLLSGGRSLRQFMTMDPKPDGIFAASDDLALGILAAAGSHGLTPGEDFQVVGFDGQDRGQQQGDVTLSTVKVPCEQMGRRAAQLLIERFKTPDRPNNRMTLECVTHHGTTTGASFQEKQV